MISIQIEFEAKPGCLERLLERLTVESRVCMEQDEGCLRMELGVPAAFPGIVFLSELWRDQASIEAHKRRPTHSHAWEQEVVARKRVLICDVIASPAKAGQQVHGG